MTAPDLKPCPFCGGRLFVKLDWALHPENACTLAGMSFHNHEWFLWNTRADPCIRRDDPALRQVMEALVWYESKASDCRKITREGDTARHALNDDGGGKARTALAAMQELIGETK